MAINYYDSELSGNLNPSGNEQCFACGEKIMMGGVYWRGHEGFTCLCEECMEFVSVRLLADAIAASGKSKTVHDVQKILRDHFDYIGEIVGRNFFHIVQTQGFGL